MSNFELGLTKNDNYGNHNDPCLVDGAAMSMAMTMRTMGMMTMRMTWRSLPGTGAGPQCPLWRMMTTEAAWRAHYKSLINKSWRIAKHN